MHIPGVKNAIRIFESNSIMYLIKELYYDIIVISFILSLFMYFLYLRLYLRLNHKDFTSKYIDN